MITLADRLTCPDGTQGLLFDMDGTILDTLGLAITLSQRLVNKYFGKSNYLSPKIVARNFGYSVPDFWLKVIDELHIEPNSLTLSKLIAEYEEERRSAQPKPNPGIVEILTAARERGFRLGVVSNSLIADIEKLLVAAEIDYFFDVIIGLDEPHVIPKPDPAPYLLASKQLGLPPNKCVAIEDSLIGVESAGRAGCYTIGVATGANLYDELRQSCFVSQCYVNFAHNP